MKAANTASVLNQNSKDSKMIFIVLTRLGLCFVSAVLLGQHLRGGEQVPDGVGQQRRRRQWRLRPGVQLHGGQLGQFADRRQSEHFLRLLLVQLVVPLNFEFGALDVALRLGQVGRVQLQQHGQRRRGQLGAQLRAAAADVRRGADGAAKQLCAGAGERVAADVGGPVRHLSGERARQCPSVRREWPGADGRGVHAAAAETAAEQ